MKFDIKALYLNSLGVSFPVCILGAIVASIGKGVESSTTAAIGGIMTLPLTALLGVPCLAIVLLGPLALAASAINPAASWGGKTLAVVALLAGAAWAVFLSTALHGMVAGINL